MVSWECPKGGRDGEIVISGALPNQIQRQKNRTLDVRDKGMEGGNVRGEWNGVREGGRCESVRCGSVRCGSVKYEV